MTGTCHSAPVCCTLFHSDALAGIEKSRMCKEATPGNCLGRSLSPQGKRKREQATHRAVSGPLSAGQSQLWKACQIRMAPAGQQGCAPPSSLLCSLPLMFLTSVQLQGNEGSPVAIQLMLFSYHRPTLGEETSLNLTRIHFSLQEIPVTTLRHGGVLCATCSTDYHPCWFKSLSRSARRKDFPS